MEEQAEIKLTRFSKGAGCGCKISPSVLEEILKTQTPGVDYPQLLVGNSSCDDAAVFDMGNGTAIISTTDFFMPIVDDAFDFGRIASANSISDIYAMGGKPLMAIAVLGWPVEKLPASLAQKVLEGARAVCQEASIPLAGGHSVDSAEPIFGLAVTGVVSTENLKKNDTAKKGDIIFLTKPLGTGILSTAQKRELLKPEHLSGLVNNMVSLNKVGELLGTMPDIHAMTDVTGFGLAGHLIEMMDGAGLSATINYSAIPLLDGTREYLSQRIIPDATFRNWNSYGTKVAFDKGVNVMEAFSLLPDPQTNGGLLIAANPSSAARIINLLSENGVLAAEIGIVTERKEKTIQVSV